MYTTVWLIALASTLEALIYDDRHQSVYTENLNQLLRRLVRIMRTQPERVEWIIPALERVVQLVSDVYDSLANCPDKEENPKQFKKEVEPLLCRLSYISSFEELKSLPGIAQKLKQVSSASTRSVMSYPGLLFANSDETNSSSLVDQISPG